MLVISGTLATICAEGLALVADGSVSQIVLGIVIALLSVAQVVLALTQREREPKGARVD